MSTHTLKLTAIAPLRDWSNARSCAVGGGGGYMREDEFWLFDLRVETIATDRPMVCNHPEGSDFEVHGENIVMGAQGQFPLYVLAAILPLLPAKQRPSDAADWMSTDAEIACPDPHCGGRFRITRLGKRRFRHSETTGLPDKRTTPYWQKNS